MEVTTTTATEIRTTSAFSGGVVIAASGDNGDYIPLVDHLLKQKFQLNNKTRQKFTADVKRVVPLKPFTMFTNNKQSNKTFLAIGYSWNVLKDTYTVEFNEYDNVSVITLVEE